MSCYFILHSVVNQLYETEILNEYVIRGNTAVLKCSIPSFVADFVYVEAWLDQDGNVFKPSITQNDNYGITKKKKYIYYYYPFLMRS